VNIRQVATLFDEEPITGCDPAVPKSERRIVQIEKNCPVYCGIDPGQSGAIAVIEHNDVGAYPFKRLTERDIYDLLCTIKPDFTLIERVHAMPKQGIASTFKFGQNYGFLRACMIGTETPFEEVAPGRWQKAMGCGKKCETRTEKKNLTKARAQQLFPHLKITHAIADALLIAEYCKRLKTGEIAA